MKGIILKPMLGAALIFAAGDTFAQAFPSRPVHIIIGLTGGAIEVSARLLAADMAKPLAQPVVVEPRTGANGTIAANFVANSSPDGYNLFYGAPVPLSGIFIKNGFIEVDKQLAPVANILVTPYVVAVGAKVPANSVQELQAYSKANPGALNFGSSASSQAMMMEVVKARTGISYLNIPYNGGSGALLKAMITGEVNLSIANPSGWSTYYKSGAVKPLFVSTAKRLPSMPTIPTAAEAGVHDFVAGSNIGFWTPRGVSKDSITVLNKAAVAAVRNPEIAEKLRGDAIGVEPSESTPEEEVRLYTEERKFFSDAARLANFQPQ